MKKILPLLLCVVLIFSGCGTVPDNPWADSQPEEVVSAEMQTSTIGDEEYYLIKTEGDLNAIGKTYPLSGRYRLENDLTLTGEWQPIGNEDKPFTGIFDGGGSIIYNLTVTKKSDGMGFFGASEGAAIRNLILKDAHILEDTHVNTYVGFAISGYASDTEFTNCSVNARE